MALGEEDATNTGVAASSDMAASVGGGGSKEGYGEYIFPMYTRNIFNKGNLKYDFTVKRQEYTTLNFTDNVRPIILPYQVLHWYFGDKKALENVKTYNRLCDISWGCTFHGARIAIEVYAVTRERLLQGGATNYKTYDFETSQNLFLSTNARQRDTFYYPIDAGDANENRVPFNAVRKDGTNTTWSLTSDLWDREEIPQREIKIITKRFEQPKHGYVYPTYKVKNLRGRTSTGDTAFAVLVPGPTGYSTGARNTTETTYTSANTEIQINKDIQEGAKEDKWETSTVVDRVSYPMMCLHPPEVADETGEMKWVYQTRISTELFVTFHVNPDLTVGQDFLGRQRVNLPARVNKDPGNTISSISIPCVPYQARVT